MKDILAPLPGPGVYLRFDPIYDQIREARRFEYEHFSQGVWKKEVKKSNFELVEDLCVNVLSKRSKDLQILGWLCEAWVARYGLDGCARSLYTIDQFIHMHWDDIFPEEDEYRFTILEWIEDILYEQLLCVQLTEDQYQIPAYYLSDFVDFWGNDTKISLFQKALKATTPSFLKTIKEHLERCFSFLDTVNKTFSYVGCDLKWSNLKKRLDEIVYAISYNPVEPAVVENSKEIRPIQSEKTSEEPDNTMLVSGRDQAYDALREIGIFLKNVDPHSPSHHLIDVILDWKGKNLIEIISDIKNKEEPAYQLLRMIGKI